MTDTSVTYRELRKHPVSSTLEGAASGALPSEPELDALGLPPAHRQKVADAAAVIAAIRAGGAHARARDEARESAAEIVGGLPPELQRPDHLRTPDTETDPRALAERVRRY